MAMLKGALVAVAAAGLSGCAAGAGFVDPIEAPAYTTQVTSDGFRYVHNWEGVPCFSMELSGAEWRLDDSGSKQVRWSRNDEVLSVYFTDNRSSAFALAGMGDEQILRAFLGYEIEYIRPRFEFQMARQPRFSREHDGTWMAWGWEGKGGKAAGVTSSKPDDQRHVVISHWIDPWVMSFDWASASPDYDRTPTLEMIELIESLEWHPQCFRALKAGSTWEGS